MKLPWGSSSWCRLSTNILLNCGAFEVTIVVRLRSPNCANCEAIGSRFAPEMSSSRLPVSTKVVFCSCLVLHESVFYSCSLSGESVADHSLGKEENRRKGVRNRGQMRIFHEDF